MFISEAWADAAAGPAGFDFMSMLPLVLIFVVFYFLMIRPQQKKMKEHREMLNQVARGDRVVTGGGIIGTVKKVVDEHEVKVEIADGVEVLVAKATISQVVAKTSTVASKTKSAGDAEDKPKAAKRKSPAKKTTKTDKAKASSAETEKKD